MVNEWKQAQDNMRDYILTEEKKRCRKACGVKVIFAVFFAVMSLVIFSAAQRKVGESVQQTAPPVGGTGIMQYMDSSSELSEKKAETAEETVRILKIVNAVLIAGIVTVTGLLCAADLKRYNRFKTDDIEYNNAVVTHKEVYRKARRSFFESVRLDLMADDGNMYTKIDVNRDMKNIEFDTRVLVARIKKSDKKIDGAYFMP